MPISVAPQPAEDEIECARCGAYFYYELTRCPECGVNIYEPEDDLEEALSPNGFFSTVKRFFRDIFGKPYSAEEVFGVSLNQADLYENLLRKVGWDEGVVERLVDFERDRAPNGTRIQWLESAIERWERDNKTLRG